MANPKICKREEIRTLTTISTTIKIKKKKKKNKRLPLRETSSTKVQTLIKLKRVSFMVKQPLRKRERERERESWYKGLETKVPLKFTTVIVSN